MRSLGSADRKEETRIYRKPCRLLKLVALISLGSLGIAALSYLLSGGPADARLSFMAGYEEVGRARHRIPREFAGYTDLDAGLEVVYRAPFSESYPKSKYALPRLGFLEGEELLPNWRTFEAADGELITLIPGNRLSKKDDRNDPRYTTIVVNYRRSPWQRKIENGWQAIFGGR